MAVNVSEGSDTFVEVYPIVEPGYITVYDWEIVELTTLRQWVGHNWKISIYASVIYVILIYVGQSWMKNRQAYNLRNVLFVWNVLLAIFSTVGFIRTCPELWHVINQPHGFYVSVCTRELHNAATACWGFLMTMSKLVELGDTAFIVLRKQPLKFLHWYHHVTVMVYTFYTYYDYEPSLRWFMTMNMAVHSLMYTYYALRAMRVKVPRQLAMLITFLQTSQMVVGVGINMYSIYIKRNGFECVRSDEVIQIAMLIYTSYFILFTHLFYTSYIGPKKSLTRSLKAKQN